MNAMDKFKSNDLARLLMIKASSAGVDIEHENTSPSEILGEIVGKESKKLKGVGNLFPK